MNANVETLNTTKDPADWIDDPVLTRGKDEQSEMAAHKPAADIAHVTAVPMHHPDSKYLRYGSDIRTGLFMAGGMFVMQVAQPQVGAGVGQLSNFKNDPWHRLTEIAKSGEAYILSGKEAALEEGRRLRELHRNIKGIDKNGKPYHSLHPKTYGWVHTVFLASIINMHRLYGEPLSRQEQQELFLQWQEGGRVFGLRDKDMPRDIDEYFAYYNHMIETELEYNDVIDFILGVDKTPPPRPNDKIPLWLWNAMMKPIGRWYREFIIFSLPENYRNKILAYQVWTDADQKRLEKRAKRIKFIFNLLPERYRYDPKAYAAMQGCPVK